MAEKFIVRVIVVAVLVFSVSLRAGEELDSLRFKYEVECEHIKAPLVVLRKKFEQRLLAIYEEYADEGDLSSALAAKSAAEAKMDPTDAEMGKAPEKVASAQKIYLKEKRSRERRERRKLQTLIGDYTERLKELTVELTKGRQLDEAVAVTAELGKIEKIAARFALQLRAEKGLCAVTISSTVKVSIKELRPGAERLSGGYRPKFDTVAKEVVGAMYTQVPWQQTPSFKITAKGDGYIYVYYGSKAEIDPTVLNEMVENIISGPWIKPGNTHRLVVKRGQEFTFKAGEGCIIAKEIDVRGGK